MGYVIDTRRGLGDAAPTATADTASVLNLGDQLRQAQNDLNNLVQLMRQSPDLARQIGADVTAQQEKLGDLISRYVYAYTAIFGQAPVGLGQVQIAAAVAVILAYVGAQLYLWYEKQKVLDDQAKTQMLAEQNRQSLLQMAQQKQDSAAAKAAAGDSAGAADDQAAADALVKQAGSGTPPPPPNDFAAWLKDNWPTAAIVAIGAFFLIGRR